MEQSPDHTIFVWGLSHSVSIEKLPAHAPWTDYLCPAVHGETDPTYQVLFAPSPRAFQGSSQVQRVSVRRHAFTAQISVAAMNNLRPEPEVSAASCSSWTYSHSGSRQPSVLNRALCPPHEVPGYGVRARPPIIQIRVDDISEIAVPVLACQGPEGSIIAPYTNKTTQTTSRSSASASTACTTTSAAPTRCTAPRATSACTSASARSRIPGSSSAGARSEIFVYHTHSFGFSFANLRAAPSRVLSPPPPAVDAFAPRTARSPIRTRCGWACSHVGCRRCAVVAAPLFGIPRLADSIHWGAARYREALWVAREDACTSVIGKSPWRSLGGRGV